MEQYIREIRVFENGEVERSEPGQVRLRSKVVESSLNLYGYAHGGYLFTLCDQVAGLVSLSLGVNSVTMQSSINYLKPGELGETLSIEGMCLHQRFPTNFCDKNNQEC